MKKLAEGTEVTINIPFTYTIGDKGFYTDKTLETIQDCKDEVLAEINAGKLSDNEVLMEIVMEAQKETKNFTLRWEHRHGTNEYKLVSNKDITTFANEENPMDDQLKQILETIDILKDIEFDRGEEVSISEDSKTEFTFIY